MNTLLRYIIYLILGNRCRQTKVTLRCEREEELLLLEAQAKSLNLCARSIQDAYVFLFDLVIPVSR